MDYVVRLRKKFGAKTKIMIRSGDGRRMRRGIPCSRGRRRRSSSHLDGVREKRSCSKDSLLFWAKTFFSHPHHFHIFFRIIIVVDDHYLLEEIYIYYMVSMKIRDGRDDFYRSDKRVRAKVFLVLTGIRKSPK